MGGYIVCSSAYVCLEKTKLILLFSMAKGINKDTSSLMNKGDNWSSQYFSNNLSFLENIYPQHELALTQDSILDLEPLSLELSLLPREFKGSVNYFGRNDSRSNNHPINYKNWA